MHRVNINLKNCYGIKDLNHELDFTKTPAYALYAPNGVMKTCLAETFSDAAKSQPSKDRIFPDREAVRHITDENGTDLEGERVLVVSAYDAEFGPTEKTSILLVSADLRKESEKLEKQVEQAKEALFKALRAQSGTRRDFESEISTAVMHGQDQFEDAVQRIRREVERQTEAPFANIRYDVVFNEKVRKALEDEGLRGAIEDYVTRYNQLLAASNYFRKGTFDYYNAGQIARSLADNGFFSANHTVTLYGGGGTVEIKTQKQLEQIIAKEKEQILTDKTLRTKFDKVQRQLERNSELREFCRYLQEDEAILSRMTNLEKFREDVLKSYLKANEVAYKELVEKLEAVEVRRAEIAEAARQQATQWDSVIRTFNERFFVPFELVAANKLAVILGQETKPLLGFVYKDGTQRADVDKNTLVKVLSTGERKALYILNVIFEVERRKAAGVETLIIVDDIADSFDYNNKYAIIQYLKEISEDDNGLFKLVMMTHNFDFFRTVESRFVGYPNCLMASKNEDGVTLVQAAGIRNVFANDWKKDFFKDARKKIASIPFLRNLIEMTTGEAGDDYKKLSSMLHKRPESNSTKVSDLDDIFNRLCGATGTSANNGKKVSELVLEEATACLTETGGLKLENKIVLAIGIRLEAERFLIAKIKDDPFVAGIKANQTRKLIERYKKDFPTETVALGVLDRVELMTPENIHVNSFMYEPIIDMGDDHLRDLFKRVTALT